MTTACHPERSEGS